MKNYRIFMERIAAIANSYSKENFPEADLKYLILYGSCAKHISGIRTNYGDIDINLFFDRSALKIYKGINTQFQPKKLIVGGEQLVDNVEAFQRKFDIARSTTRAKNIDELILEVSKKESKRWKVMNAFPHLIMDLKTGEIVFRQFLNCKQNDYVNQNEFEVWIKENPNCFAGFHSVYNDQGKILKSWKELYDSPTRIPTFNN